MLFLLSSGFSQDDGTSELQSNEGHGHPARIK